VKPVLWAWLLAWLLLVATGALVPWLPDGFAPDPGLLIVVAIGLRVGGTRSLAVAWAIGATADLLSGAPFGHHGLLYVLAWALTRVAQGQVELRRSSALAPYTFALTLGMAGIALAVAPAPDGWWRTTLSHAAVNALLAPWAARAFAALLDTDRIDTLRGPTRLHAGAQ